MGPIIPILDPKYVHLDPKIGPNNFKNISISTGSKHWARRPSIIHFLICFPDISHFLGKMGPKMTILDPKQVHLDPAIGPNYLKKNVHLYELKLCQETQYHPFLNMFTRYVKLFRANGSNNANFGPKIGPFGPSNRSKQFQKYFLLYELKNCARRPSIVHF